MYAIVRRLTKRTTWWVLGGLFVAVAALIALTLQGLRSSDDRGSAQKSVTEPSRTSGAAPGVPSETPPWQATPENTTTLPPGTVPAWRVNPPPPDPNAPLPPPPKEPPNPALNRPPMDNPGGVNGDRPERKVPGVE